MTLHLFFKTFLLSKYNKLNWFNNIFTFKKLGFIPIENPILGNKILLLTMFFIGIFIFRDFLLIIVSGLLPRKSHVAILKESKKYILDFH